MRRPRWPRLSVVATTVVIGTTALWALAYMNVFRQPDSRLAASAVAVKNVPPDSKILVEPSHNTPPMGSYLNGVNFHSNYVLFYPADGKARLLSAVRARYLPQPVQPRRRTTTSAAITSSRGSRWPTGS